jgi:hypothetical protein
MRREAERRGRSGAACLKSGVSGSERRGKGASGAARTDGAARVPGCAAPGPGAAVPAAGSPGSPPGRRIPVAAALKREVGRDAWADGGGGR